MSALGLVDGVPPNTRFDEQERELLKVALASLLQASIVLTHAIVAIHEDADRSLGIVRSLNDTLAVGTWHLEQYALKRVPAAGCG